MHDDDIDRVSDEDISLGHGGDVGGDGDDVSGSGASLEGGFNVPSSSGNVPIKEKEYAPSLLRATLRWAPRVLMLCTFISTWMAISPASTYGSMPFISSISTTLKISTSCFVDKWTLIAGNVT